MALPLLLASCGSKEPAPLLTGNVAAGDSVKITAYYDLDGDVYMEDIYSDSLGNFSYSPEIPAATDLTLYINGDSYGVRLDNGSTVNIAIDSIGNAELSGDNLPESRWLTTVYGGYNAMKFKHNPLRDGEYVMARYMEMADNTKAASDALLPEVRDEALRAYYERLGNQYYNRTRSGILSADYYFNHYGKDDAQKPVDDEEIDPNGDEARRSGALFDWMRGIRPSDNDQPMTAVILDISSQIDTLLTNEANKRMLHKSLADMAFQYNLPLDQLRPFVQEISPRLTPHQLQDLLDKIDEIESRTKDGDMIPVDPVLVTPDGSKKTLTEACGGKIAYIDVWATWCGPCCAQIPYMEKLAESYRNNDKVICISISCDEDSDAWLRKLEKDNPEWPQYAFSGEEGQKFMTALGINGIPRFIIINPDMTIARIDAPRPQSADKVREIIDGILAK